MDPGELNKARADPEAPWAEIGPVHAVCEAYLASSSSKKSLELKKIVDFDFAQVQAAVSGQLRALGYGGSIHVGPQVARTPPPAALARSFPATPDPPR